MLSARRRALSPDARGWIEARIALESIEHGVRRLLAFADEVEGIAPAALRTQMRERNAAIAAIYAAPADANVRPARRRTAAA